MSCQICKLVIIVSILSFIVSINSQGTIYGVRYAIDDIDCTGAPVRTVSLPMGCNYQPYGYVQYPGYVYTNGLCSKNTDGQNIITISRSTRPQCPTMDGPIEPNKEVEGACISFGGYGIRWYCSRPPSNVFPGNYAKSTMEFNIFIDNQCNGQIFYGPYVQTNNEDCVRRDTYFKADKISCNPDGSATWSVFGRIDAPAKDCSQQPDIVKMIKPNQCVLHPIGNGYINMTRCVRNSASFARIGFISIFIMILFILA